MGFVKALVLAVPLLALSALTGCDVHHASVGIGVEQPAYSSYSYSDPYYYRAPYYYHRPVHVYDRWHSRPYVYERY